MILCVKATTNNPRAHVDFIEVRTPDGHETNLTWGYSEYNFTESGFEAEFTGVEFNGENAAGRIGEMDGAQITALQLYDIDSDKEYTAPVITEMTFIDGDKRIEITNDIYTKEN